MSVILYLHGFLSSPLSQKAQITLQWVQEYRPDLTYTCPTLPSLPRDTKAFLSHWLTPYSGEKVYVVGSSLGGFWAHYLVEAGLAEKAVLVNPAVLPASRFTEFVGSPMKHYYSDDIITLTDADIHSLAACEPKSIQVCEKYWVMLQTGDQTLDYRLAEAKFSQCQCLVEAGGSHTFEGYKNWLPNIIEFFGI